MKKHKISPVLLLAFALFNNPIIIGNYDYYCYALIYGLPLLYIVLNINRLMPYIKGLPISIFRILVWTAIALTLSAIVPTLHGTYDYTYINVILGIYRKAIICTFLFLLTGEKHKQNDIVELFMLCYILANALYVFSTVAFIIMPSLKTVWSSILQLNLRQRNLLTAYGYAGRFGWSGFSGFRNTIDCTLSAVFCTYLYAGARREIRINSAQYVVLLLICAVGNMFYGRSGVVASALCVFGGLILYKKITIKLCVEVFLTVLSAFAAISYLKSQIRAINDWYIWASTPFINLFKTGSFNNYSADHLLNDMIFMPEPKTFWFGDARYVDPTDGYYYMHTDVGFMRQILFWGVILTALMYGFWLFSIMCMKRDMVFKLMCFAMCIIFEIKGETYYELLPLFTVIAAIDKMSTHSKNISECMVYE